MRRLGSKKNDKNRLTRGNKYRVFDGSSVDGDENDHKYKLWAGLSWDKIFNSWNRNTKQAILTEVLKQPHYFQGVQFIFFIFTPEQLSSCKVDWQCWDCQGGE